MATGSHCEESMNAYFGCDWEKLSLVGRAGWRRAVPKSVMPVPEQCSFLCAVRKESATDIADLSPCKFCNVYLQALCRNGGCYIQA